MKPVFGRFKLRLKFIKFGHRLMFGRSKWQKPAKFDSFQFWGSITIFEHICQCRLRPPPTPFPTDEKISLLLSPIFNIYNIALNLFTCKYICIFKISCIVILVYAYVNNTQWGAMNSLRILTNNALFPPYYSYSTRNLNNLLVFCPRQGLYLCSWIMPGY